MGKLESLKPSLPLAELCKAEPMPTALDFADRRRGSPHQRGYGAAWRRLRAEILRRDDYLCRCADCRLLGRIRPAHEVDHVVNKAQGGTDDPSNLQAINRDCHRLKTQREAQESRR